jgi:uncharacterized protein
MLNASSSARTCAPDSTYSSSFPGDTFHTARIIGKRRWFLGANTEWPGVIPADVEIGNLDALIKKYPAVADDLLAIAASVQIA